MGTKDGRRRTGREDGAGRARATVLSRRRVRARRPARTIRSLPRCTRTSSRIEDQIDQLRTKKSSMTADAYDDALEASARAAGAQGEDDPRDGREEIVSADAGVGACVGGCVAGCSSRCALAAHASRAGRRPRGAPDWQVSGSHHAAVEGARQRQRIGSTRSAISCAPTRRSASTTKPSVPRAARRPPREAARSGIRSARCCSCAASAPPPRAPSFAPEPSTRPTVSPRRSISPCFTTIAANAIAR